MSTDLWEQLAEREVPAPPKEFDRHVHERLNRSLVVLHMTDLLIKGLLYGVGHFAQAVIHLLVFTLTGRLGSQKKQTPPETPSM